jgi:acyl-CoA synthetase (AMP-forming)/AMP-acid ligase II
MVEPRPTLFAHVAAQAASRPDAPALHGAGGIVDYATLERRVRGFAAGLAAQGVARGDTVAVQLPNGVEFVVTLLAATALGAVVQTVHMPYRRAELASLLAHGRARAFVGPSRFRDASPVATVLALRDAPDASLPALRTVVHVGAAVEGALDWAALAEAAPAATLPAIAADDPYVLLYTSGTTASPKGVPTTGRRFLDNARDAIGELGVGPDDVLLSAAPFTHLYGLFVLQCALAAGASASLLPAFSPPELVATLRRDRVTALFAGPAHVKPLLDQDALRAEDVGSVRLVCLSGTTVPPSLAREVEARLRGGVVIQLWGMSELQAGAYGRPSDPPSLRHETAGRAAPGTALRVVAEPGGPALPPGTEGRLQVRGPSVFEGYLDNPQATAAAFDDGWFDTGDTARLGDDGSLTLTGRVKELIDRGGVKFNPVDVEVLLDAVPGVGRCVLVPMPDPVLGERTCAFVVRNGHAPVTLGALTAALDAAGVAKFKWPERLEFIDELPVTPTQKVRRAELTRLLTEGTRG